MPKLIGRVISSKLATLSELDTILGIEDVYDLLEVMAVDSYNKNLAMKK